MNCNYIIRHERQTEYHQVEDLVREAFWNVYRPGCLEHYVLHCLRDDPAFIPELDFVLEADGKLIAGLDACITAFKILYLSTVYVDEAYRLSGREQRLSGIYRGHVPVLGQSRLTCFRLRPFRVDMFPRLTYDFGTPIPRS